MRRFLNGAISVLVALSAMLAMATGANANVIAGGGYSSSYAGESIFTTFGAGQTGQNSAIFFNDGTQTWMPGVVGLLICAADKVTCNVPANSAYNHGWYSQTVYATVTSPVAPGQNGFFVYSFDVPVATPANTTTTFYGDVGLIATGAEFRPEGYFQINTTPAASLTLTPSPATLQVGTTVQFTVGGLPVGTPISWSVNGGCGAITSAGLFAATAMNSPTQPCTVVASGGGSSGIATVIVYGNPSTLGCSATPTSIVANGGITGGTAIATVSLKDPNGNTVANASSPQINIANVTPGLATMTPTGLQTPNGGSVSVTIATTTAPGSIQLSASAVGLTGCNVIVTSTGPGAPAKTIATFTATPIAADGTSTSTLQVDVTDANGNRVVTDNGTNITVTRDSSSAFVCNILGTTATTGTNSSAGAGSGIATDVNGRIAFTVQSTTTPGQCLFFAVTNNSSIAGSSAAMSTQIVGVAQRISVLSNDQGKPASNSGTCTVAGPNTDQSCTTIVLAVQDANGSVVTSDNGRVITASFDTASCTGNGATPNVRQQTNTSSGKATFAISSAGAYNACAITFSSSGLNSVTTTAQWTAGGADHLACTFSPNPIVADGSSSSAGTVSVRDQFGNVVSVGSYNVSFQRTGGSGVTTLLSSSPQNPGSGLATFTVRSSTTAGTDTYTPVLNSGTLPHAATTCDISEQ